MECSSPVGPQRVLKHLLALLKSNDSVQILLSVVGWHVGEVDCI